MKFQDHITEKGWTLQFCGSIGLWAVADPVKIMNRCAKSRVCAGRARGFTLIELLLVIALLGIICLAITPMMVKSIRGNRLRSASRAVISSGRYARSMAVMRQTRLPLVFNLDAGSISVGDVPAEQPDLIKVENAEIAAPTNSPAATNGAVNNEAAPPDVRMERILDGVRIESVEMDGGESFAEGFCVVFYEQNGRCVPYTVKLADEHDEEVTIEVDALATPKATWRR